MAFMKLKSIRTKLTLLLFSIALIPLLIVIAFYLLTNIKNSIANAKSDGLLRNSIVNEHLTELFERNLAVLRTIARNPITIHYVQADSKSRDPIAVEALKRTNEVFNDSNHMVITDQNGDQIARSDTAAFVNVSHRRYFQQAMYGEEHISDVLVSLVNKRLIAIVEVPVLDDNDTPIGMVYRNYDISALKKFVKNLSSKHTRVMITDSVGNIVAHSEENFDSNQLVGMSSNPAVSAALAGKTGSIDVNIQTYKNTKKERMLLSYSKNEISGWTIVTERPYRYIWQSVITEAVTAVILGAILLLAIAVVASFVAEKATRKIRAVSSLANRAVDDNADPASFAELGDDELGQMAMAINKIRYSRDLYRKDAEVDKLTGLLNKATFERLCRKRLAENTLGTFSALIIIDLDHFKEVNDTLGHQTGDSLLHDFGEVLRRLFRPTDLIGRFGGDEFIVFLNDLPGKEIVIQKAKRIAEAATNILIGVNTIAVSASVGISTTPLHGIDYDTLFASADKSLYTVKESGRNGVCYGSEPVIKL